MEFVSCMNFISLQASSSCDGTVRVWEVDDQELVKVLTGFHKSNDISTAKISCRIAWEKTGKVCVLNTRD